MKKRQSLADVLKVLISVSSQTLIGSTHDPVKSDNSRQQACFMEGIVFNSQPFWVSMKTQCYFLCSFRSAVGKVPNPYRRRTHGPFYPLLFAVKSNNNRQEALLACFMEAIVFNSWPFWVSMKTQCYVPYPFRLEVGKVA
ncbi:hypothetical protein CDAR_122711 [Caerostris darwini]|uniref:LAGLIDADG homing endonuclease n=1 Tax=Caerostris darwini TaxID=1538125 RepID=A0AAV4UY67_9ARAC|nr:hypothetical protein CDAR_122711 [Caerostris darwini]